MIARSAIQRFSESQRQLVHDAYDEAWRQGVAGYQPDDDPQQPSSRDQHQAEEATLSGVALLRARTGRAYVAPSSPDMQRRQVALAGPLASTDRMAVQLAQVAPGQQHFDQADQAVQSGEIDATRVTVFALGLAVADWAQSNSYRLDLGDSVAWAGEQAGYAEAADTDGKLLSWQSEDDDSVCEDCSELEAMGPLPLSDFPTMPGDGATECSQGCRCSVEAVDVGPVAGDSLTPLSDEQNAAIEKIAGQAQQRMDATAPSFAAYG